MKDEPKSSEEFDRFTALVDRVIAVPRADIQKRQEDYLREQAAKPARRGPKPKTAKRPS